MKTSVLRTYLFFPTAIFFLALAFTPLVWAQGQRIALLPTKVPLKLLPGQTRGVESVCVDLSLDPPEVGEIYNQVLTPNQEVQVSVEGEKPMSLADALKNEIVRFKGASGFGNYLDIENTDSKRRQVSLQVKKPMVLHSQPGQYEGWSVLKKIDETLGNPSSNSLSFGSLQLDVWKESERLREIAQVLIDSGYLKTSPQETRNEVIGQALRQFEKANGLAESVSYESGNVSPATAARLKQKAAEVSEVYSRVLQAQTFNLLAGSGLKAEGTVKAKLPAKREMLAVQSSYTSPATKKDGLPDEQRILTVSAGADIELQVLRRQAGFRYVADSTVLKNEAAIEEMDKLSRKLVADKSDATTRVLHAGSYKPTSSGRRGELTLQFGDKAVKLTAVEHDALFNDKSNTPIPELDNAMNTLGDAKRIIIYRDAFAQGYFGHGGGRISVDTSTEGPQQYVYHESRRHVHPTELVARLKARYGQKADFLLDDELDTGKANAANIPLVTKGADVVAYVAPNDPLEREKSAKKADYGIINNISDYLKEAKIDVERSFNPRSETNVVVLTGHKDFAFVDYVSRLGESKVFRGRIVAMASCYEVGDEALNSLIVREYGAKAVVFFDKRLNANAVESVLFELTQLLKEPGFTPTRLDELLNRSVDRALEKSENARWREDIQKMRRSVIQVSQVESKNDAQNKLG